MQLKAMETMGQTQKQGKKSDGVPPAKKKNSTGDAIGYSETKAEELELRREKIELRRQDEVQGSQLCEQRQV